MTKNARSFDKTHRCPQSIAQRVSIRRDRETKRWVLSHMAYDPDIWEPLRAKAATISFCPFCGVSLEGDTEGLIPVQHGRWEELPNTETSSTDYADYIAYLALTSGNAVYVQCKKCGGLDRCAPKRKPPFCRSCGARMDGKGAGE